MNGMITAKKTAISGLRARAVAAAVAVVAAVALPQLFHAVGKISGLGTALGETFLPMHLAVLAAGLLAGPVVGGIVGAVAPAISFGLSGMPSLVMLPFMTVELTFYGLTAGGMALTKAPSFVSLVVAEVAGRAARAAAIAIGVYAFGAHVAVSTIWTSLAVGLPGILLQWAVLPLLVYFVARVSEKK